MDGNKAPISARNVSPCRAAAAVAMRREHVAADPDLGHSGALLRVAGLTKRYGDQTALSSASFDVQAGELVGLIGPNGAGKTTLLEAVAGLLPMDTGDVAWRGESVPLARRRDVMFYLPDGIKPYRDQPVARVLTFFAGVYRCSTRQVGDTVAALGLTPVLTQRVQSLSKGYNRRLLLALGLIAPHPLLLMDEPFDGFDLRQARAIGGVLRQAAANGRTLLLAIHQLADAERICDRFILLSGGHVRGVGSLSDLRAQTGLPAATLEEVFLALT
jgi:ABC-2 type transport system ATP-binding protein